MTRTGDTRVVAREQMPTKRDCPGTGSGGEARRGREDETMIGSVVEQGTRTRATLCRTKTVGVV